MSTRNSRLLIESMIKEEKKELNVYTFLLISAIYPMNLKFFESISIKK
jgi:hypothetical protein